MMGMVQNKLRLIQHYPKPGAMAGLYFGAQVVEQGFKFTPMNIGADRVLKDGLEDAEMVAHRLIIIRTGIYQTLL